MMDVSFLTIASFESGWNHAVKNPSKPYDCDDSNRRRNPGQREKCNGIDDDCSNGVDRGDSVPDFESRSASSRLASRAPRQWNTRANKGASSLSIGVTSPP